MGNYSVRLTNEIGMPPLAYINELAREKNFHFDNTFSSAPDILKDLHYLFTKERELGSAFVKEEHILNRKTIEKHVIKRPMDREEQAYYFYNLNFLTKVDICAIMGFSPMDKALNVIMFTVKLAEEEPEDESSYAGAAGTTEAEDTSVSPIKLEKSVNHFSDPAQKQEQSGAVELSKSLTSCVKDFLDDLSPEIMALYGAKNKLAMPVDLKIFKDIKIKSYLESKLGMQETKEKKYKDDVNSKEKKFTNMSSVSDVSKVSKSSIVMPDFAAKVAKKELMVNKKVAPITKKQAFVLLLDDSGSMGCIGKQRYVRAVLLNRLEPVVKGKAQLDFHLYESGRYGKRVVKTLDDAKALFDEICHRRPGGGGTNIGAVLQDTIDECCAMPGFHSPEIMIVCDGDDFVDAEKLSFKGVKINVVVLGRNNEGLKAAAVNSGGWYTAEAMYL